MKCVSIVDQVDADLTVEMSSNATECFSVKPKRGQANKRERVRTENVNAGFDKLRKLIPTDPVDRKLSKIEILRLATSYISHLYNLTTANSCLEASSAMRSQKPYVKVKLEKLESFESTDEKGVDEEIPIRIMNHNDSKKHVCTFCLMMMKAKSTSSNKRPR